MIIICLVLGILYVLEFSTSIIRKMGYQNNHPEAGLQIQSSLGVLSRFLMLIMMPLLGYMADKNIINFTDQYYFLILTFLIYFICFSGKKIIFNLSNSMIIGMLKYGSLFNFKYSENKFNNKKNKYSTKKFNIIFVLILILYIPYYLSWPICFVLLELYNENRAMIISSAGLISGINTIFISIFIDPLFIKLGRKEKLISFVYDKLIYTKFISFLLSQLIFVILICFI